MKYPEKRGKAVSKEKSVPYGLLTLRASWPRQMDFKALKHKGT